MMGPRETASGAASRPHRPGADRPRFSQQARSVLCLPRVRAIRRANRAGADTRPRPRRIRAKRGPATPGPGSRAARRANEDKGEKNPVPKTKSRSNRMEYRIRQPERPPASHISTRWRGVALPRSVAPAPEPGPSPDSRASVGGSISSPPAAAAAGVRAGSPPSRGRRKKDKGLHGRAVGRAGYRPIQAHTRCGHGVGRIGRLHARNDNRI